MFEELSGESYVTKNKNDGLCFVNSSCVYKKQKSKYPLADRAIIRWINSILMHDNSQRLDLSK